MPRRARIMLPNVPIHAIQRGNDRQQCFFADSDRSFYLHQLGRMLRPLGCVLHAYCLMPNHVHLLLTPLRKDSCAKLMKHVGQLHAQYVNRLYARTGTLWEGRFRSCLVQTEEYLLQCYRYIEANPVRAGLVAHARHYPWSSYEANAHGDSGTMVTPHDEYKRLGRSDYERRLAYRELFESSLPPGAVEKIRAATNGNFALGDRSFQVALEQALGRRTRPGSPGRPRKDEGAEGQGDLFAAAKNVVCP